MSYNAVTRKINSSPTLRWRFTKAWSAQHSRIRNKWTRVEKKILKDHLDAGKSVVDFRKWQEALEDPKTENQQVGSETELLDLRERIELLETG